MNKMGIALRNKMGIAPIVNFLRPGFSWPHFFYYVGGAENFARFGEIFFEKSVLKICVVGKMVVILHRFCAKNGV